MARRLLTPSWESFLARWQLESDWVLPATWQRWLPELAAENVVNVQIFLNGGDLPADANHAAPLIVPRDEYDENGQTLALDPTCIYEVIDGEWADWIPGVAAQRVRCTAWIRITHKDGTVRDAQHHAEPTLVSLNTGGVPSVITQTTRSINAYAEPIPAGLAQAMWTSWHNLAIEGSFTNVENIPGTQKITRSNCLNFLTANPGQNGRPDWRNVNAAVQRISGSFLKGTTRVEFGAPLRVTGNELIDAIRATRYRTTTIDLGYLFGGALGGGGSGNVKMGRKTHARSAHAGADKHVTLNVSAATEPQQNIDPSINLDGTTGIITLSPPSPDGQSQASGSAIMDPSKLMGSDDKWHTIQFQEVTVCKSDGTQWTAIMPISDYYKAPGQT